MPAKESGKRRGRPPLGRTVKKIGRLANASFGNGTDDLGSTSDLSDTEAYEDLLQRTARKRGRPRQDSSVADPDQVTRQKIEGPAIAIDEAGEQKVDELGRLLDGREYRSTTFVLPNRDGKLLMLASDPAKDLGYRDSYLLFGRNPNLERVHISEAEKQWLVDQGLLFSSHRLVSIVTARSLFKCFGHKVVKHGRPEVDDYFETQATHRSDAITVHGKAWMHQAALAVRVYNAELHQHRHERQPFYDVHTDVRQVASMLQPTSCRYKSTGERSAMEANIDTMDFETSSAAHFRGIGQELLESSSTDQEHEDSAGFSISCSLDEYKSTTKPDSDYPIAIIEKQFQAIIPIHTTRFNQPIPKFTHPSTYETQVAKEHYITQLFHSANRGATSQMAAPGVNPAAAVTSGVILPRPTLSSTASAPVPLTDFQCGHTTQKGQPCIRAVAFAGGKCQRHAPLVAAPTDISKPGGLVLQEKNSNVQTLRAENECMKCHSLLAPVDAKNGKMTAVCSASAIIKCTKCQKKYHPTCAGFKTPRQVATVESYPWSCADCKVCCVCKSTGDKASLLVCGGCDRSWHSGCSHPKTDGNSTGADWRCPLCANCHSCDDRANENTSYADEVAPPRGAIEYPIYLATYCDKCHGNFEQNRFCPVCLKTFSEEEENEDEENEMVACDVCDRWVHTGCDQILTPEKYQSLCEDEQAKYHCPLCSKRHRVIVDTVASKKALNGDMAPSGCPVGLLGGNIEVRGVISHGPFKVGVPKINGTGIAEMPTL